MMDLSTGRMNISLVDVSSEKYEVGRKYMIRLAREDFEVKNAKALAKSACMGVKEFLCRFSYLGE